MSWRELGHQGDAKFDLKIKSRWICYQPLVIDAHWGVKLETCCCAEWAKVDR